MFFISKKINMSTYSICQLTLIPIRKEPAERSEMISQLLFGETFEILEYKNIWSLIKTQFDGYVGWVSTKMITLLDEDDFKNYQAADKIYSKGPICRVSLDGGKSSLYLAGGSTLIEKNNQVMFNNHRLEIDLTAELHRQNSMVDIAGTALKFLNAPYLWGGRTIFGIDCSGLTQIVYKMNGLALPRDAHQQAETGITIPTIEDVKPGDLAFFENNKGRIDHTGIVLENDEIIHASNFVRIDKLDGRGIFDRITNEYSHKICRIKRIL